MVLSTSLTLAGDVFRIRKRLLLDQKINVVILDFDDQKKRIALD